MLLELAGKQDRKNKGYAFHRKHFGHFFLFSAQPETEMIKNLDPAPARLIKMMKSGPQHDFL